jgi:hypothetical protein
MRHGRDHDKRRDNSDGTTEEEVQGRNLVATRVRA